MPIATCLPKTEFLFIGLRHTANAPVYFHSILPLGTLTRSWGRPQSDHAENVSCSDRPERLRDDAPVLVDRHLLRDTDASGGVAEKVLLPAHVDVAAAGGTRALRRNARLDSMVAFVGEMKWLERGEIMVIKREASINCDEKALGVKSNHASTIDQNHRFRTSFLGESVYS